MLREIVRGYRNTRDRASLGDLLVEVEKGMKEAPQAVGVFKVKVTFPKISLDEGMKKRLEGAAKACPVKNSLDPRIEIVSEFVY